MNVNKKLARLKQWTGERMGGEVRTNVSDDFKALEMEMGLRYEGIKNNHQAMNDYVKSLNQKIEGTNREKQLPIAALGSTMIVHGQDFEMNSEFGQCLSTIGQANERLGRAQDAYSQKASTTWLDSLERSTAQHKELSKSRKKLEDRRLAFDTASIKMEKGKGDDYRAEEELRSQRAKYEEANEDVYRRMLDIKEAEAESVTDLTEFLDAQLAYFEKCRDILLQAKREWPSGAISDKRITRSRSNTGSSYGRGRFDTIDEQISMAPPQPPRPGISSGSRAASSSLPQSPARELPGFDWKRPGVNRSSTYDGSRRDISPASSTYSVSRLPSDNLSIRTQRSMLRSVSQGPYMESPISPTDSTSSVFADQGTSNGITVAKKKPPPPPPPSRSTKPPPPLPAVRRPLQPV